MTRQRDLYASAIKSRNMIREALLELMTEKSFEKISVNEIMQRADLVRRTFYAHYKTKTEVLTNYIDKLTEDSLHDTLMGVKACNGTLALAYFRLWYEHKTFISILKKCDKLILLNNFKKHIEAIDQQRNAFDRMGFSEPIKRHIARFYADSMWSVLVQWVESGMKETPEELSDIIEELYLVSSKFSEENKAVEIS